MAKLVQVFPEGASRTEWELGERNTLGRQPDQNIQILDRVVSKEHALITRHQGRYVFADLGSRNGSFINNVRVQHPVYLQDGDEITVGSTRLRFVQKSADSSSALNRVTIGGQALETNIQFRLARSDDKFLPESEIRDVSALRRDYEKLRVAVELSQSLGLERDLDALLEKILNKAFDIFAADRGVILLIDEETGELVPRKVKTRNEPSGSTSGEGIALSQTILNEVVNHKAAVLSSDATLDSRFGGAHSIIFHGIRSAMAVPAMCGDKLLGVIHLDSRISTGAFTEKDLQLLSGFANQAAAAIENSRLVRAMEAEALVRDRLKRMLSPNLVEEVVSGRLQVKKGGEPRVVTVLFSDIRGFTSMCEAREGEDPEAKAQEIVSILNDYFEVMVDIVFAHEGTLDKFVGDELMAIWGAPVARPDDPVRAVRAAIEMMDALRRLNLALQARNPHFKGLEIGIGINTGTVVSGYMGSSKKMEYTVIGDTVNLGARLCSAAGPWEILLSEATYRACGGEVIAEPMPLRTVKGKSAPVQIYRIPATRPQASLDEDSTMSANLLASIIGRDASGASPRSPTGV